jgi:hypothetical protein
MDDKEKIELDALNIKIKVMRETQILILVYLFLMVVWFALQVMQVLIPAKPEIKAEKPPEVVELK